MASTADEKPATSSFKFLSFSTNDEDREKVEKLKQAASKIEQAIAKQNALNELVDYKPQADDKQSETDTDNLSLYERLELIKKKKDEAFEESHKLSNYVATLDEDDLNYLNEVSRSKREYEIKKRLELSDALEDMKKKKTIVKSANDEEEKLKQELTHSNLEAYERKKKSIRDRLSSLLKVKPKRSKEEPTDGERVTRSSARNKQAPEQSDQKSSAKKTNQNDKESKASNKRKRDKEGDSDDEDKNRQTKKPELKQVITEKASKYQMPIMRCIGVLPSASIVSKMDSDSDSDTSHELDLESGHLLLPTVSRPRCSTNESQ